MGKGMPVLFIGHGSPMNAIDDNEYAHAWADLAKRLPIPKAILTISAHWYTDKSLVTISEAPHTIHDFGGFPEELYEMLYAAPGAPDLAAHVVSLATGTPVSADESWGLDHGTWVPLKRMYPQADIPVVQLSLNCSLADRDHYQLGGELRPLRDEGVLILASGNIVHNLAMVDPSMPADGFDWAEDFRRTVSNRITSGLHERLIAYKELGEAAPKAVPTPDHYWPLLYALGASEPDESIELLVDECIYGAVSMTSIAFGL